VHRALSNDWRRHLWLYGPLLVWIALIFVLGSGTGSMTETSRFIRPLLEFLFPHVSPETLTIYHGYIRKFAHFAEYGVLAVLALRAFAGAPVLNLLGRYRYGTAFLLVLVVAATDEFLQSFQPGRTASAYDVLIDLSGGVVALAVIYIYSKF